MENSLRLRMGKIGSHRRPALTARTVTVVRGKKKPMRRSRVLAQSKASLGAPRPSIKRKHWHPSPVLRTWCANVSHDLLTRFYRPWRLLWQSFVLSFFTVNDQVWRLFMATRFLSTPSYEGSNRGYGKSCNCSSTRNPM